MTQSGKHYSNDFPVFATDYVHWPKRIEGAVLASDQFYQYQAAGRLAHKLATIEKDVSLSPFPSLKRLMHPTSAASRRLKPH